MARSPLHLDRLWTFDTLVDAPELPDDGRRYEIVDGNLVVTPPPTQAHQLRSNGLRDQLRDASPGGWRFLIALAVPLAEDQVRVPDVAVVRWPPLHPRPDRRNPIGPADVGLVVEVVSPRTRRTDRFAKPGEYAEAGVPLFWRLETEPDLVLHTFALRGPAYEPTETVTGRATVTVPWGRLVLDLATLRV